MIENILVNGLISGGVYALLALGFSLIFGVARIINMGHTAFYMLSAYALYSSIVFLGLHPLLATVVAVVVVALVGMACYKLTIEPIRQHETTVLIVTIAVAMAFQELILMMFSGTFRGLPSYIPGSTYVGAVKVTYQHLLTFVVLFIVLVATWLVLMRTKVGLALRCSAQDREVANLMGMNVSRIALLTMAMAVVLAAIAGALVAPLSVLEPQMWLHPLIIILAIVVLGGLGSIKGSIVGAFILAFAETLVVFLVPNGAFLRGAMSLSIMLAVLLMRPEGLFGVVFEEER